MEREDRARRVAERWRYDEDDRFPAFEGPEELERQLFDDYEAKWVYLIRELCLCLYLIAGTCVTT